MPYFEFKFVTDSIRRRTSNKMSAHMGVPRFQGPIYHQEKTCVGAKGKKNSQQQLPNCG